jgi:membrane protease YdiL (CAAX protease family)
MPSNFGDINSVEPSGRCCSTHPKLPPETKARYWVEFIIIGLIYVSRHLVHLRTSVPGIEFTFYNLHSQPPVLTLLAALFLWINGGFQKLNFSWPAKWLTYCLQLLLLLVVFIVGSEILTRLVYEGSGLAPEATEIKRQFQHPQYKYIWALVVLPIWAFAEEFFYRGYLIQRIEQLSSSWKYSTLLAVLMSSALFAVNHIHHGVGGLPSHFFSALLFSGVYLYTKRSLWFVAIVHYLNNASFLIG